MNLKQMLEERLDERIRSQKKTDKIGVIHIYINYKGFKEEDFKAIVEHVHFQLLGIFNIKEIEIVDKDEVITITIKKYLEDEECLDSKFVEVYKEDETITNTWIEVMNINETNRNL